MPRIPSEPGYSLKFYVYNVKFLIDPFAGDAISLHTAKHRCCNKK